METALQIADASPCCGVSPSAPPKKTGQRSSWRPVATDWLDRSKALEPNFSPNGYFAALIDRHSLEAKDKRGGMTDG
jgi:hypothetical protein